MSECKEETLRRTPPLSALEASLLVLGVFFVMIAASRSWWTSPRSGSVLAWVAAQTVPVFSLLIGSAWFARRYRAVAANWRPAGWGVVLLAGLSLVGAGCAGANLSAPTPLDSLAGALPPPLRAVWVLVWVGALAPVIEEFYFRGVLQSALSEWRGTYPAVAISAAVFALAHVGLSAIALWLVLGAVFGALLSATRCLLVPVCAHIGWNLGSLLAGMGLQHGIAPVLAGLALAVLLVYARLKQREGGRRP